MNLVEFLFALGAVTLMTTVQLLWTRFVYKIENSKPIDQELQQNKIT